MPRRLDPGQLGPPEGGQPSRGSAVLHIRAVTPADAGVYYCVSENDGGRTEMRFEIIGKWGF